MKISPSYLFKSVAYSLLRGLYLLSRQSWFRPILRFLAKLLKSRKDIRFNVHGKIMYGRTMDRIAALLLWKYSTLEDYETILMQEMIAPGMTVLDIGANIGYHTLKISQWVGEQGKVFAFEPDPENYRLLLKALEANNCTNVTVYQKAVSNENGQMKLYFCEENRGDHRIYDSGDHRESFTIDSITLDEFMPSDIKIDAIKIDIQGAEPFAFEGMNSLLDRQDKMVVFCEFFPDVFRYYEYPPMQFLEMVEAHGFKIQVVNDHERKLSKIANDRIVSMCKGEKYVNLLLTK